VSFPNRKTYSTENAYNNHLLSHRHRDNAARAAAAPAPAAAPMEVEDAVATAPPVTPLPAAAPAAAAPAAAASTARPTGTRPEVLGRFATQLAALATAAAEAGDALTDADELALIDQKIANARFLTLSECLFCLKDSGSLERCVAAPPASPPSTR
jgi:hypothetical protein